jgi:hypothetical protein
MSAPLNLQLKSEIFYSSVDLASGSSNSLMTPSNTWKINILSGFASTASFATQEIKYNQLGDSPKRGYEKHNVAINPVDWSFQNYVRPTGAKDARTADTLAESTSLTGNVKPIADWFLWQALVSNTAPTNGTEEQSVWLDGGILTAKDTSADLSVHSSTSNYKIPVSGHLYFKLDNVVYQVSNAVVNEAVLNADIQDIATTTWSGFGTSLTELINENRDNAISVFGGILNNGTSINSNAVSDSMYESSSYHPFSTMKVGVDTHNNVFIKNRLSAIELSHSPVGGEEPVSYIFTLTSLSFAYNNDITYINSNNLAKVNRPLQAINGLRQVSGTAVTYLRAGDLSSSKFLNSIREDTRLSSASNSSARIIIGGDNLPYFAISLESVQFDIPQITTDTIIAVEISFYAQNNGINILSAAEVQENIIRLLSEQDFLVVTEDNYNIIL